MERAGRRTGGPRLCAVVVGARRRRQGTGPYIARYLAQAGVDVAAIAGTSEASISSAQADLAPAGLNPAGFADPARLFEAVSPDVVAIASPSETHETWLEHALARGAHALCEKPLVWGGAEVGRRGARWAEAFRRRDLHLVVAAQWPFTLPTYRALHPGVLEGPPSRFTMHLAPPRPGPDLVPDALPHALSLLAAALPDPAATVLEPEVRLHDPGGRGAEVRFGYAAAGRIVEARVTLRTQPQGPRPAGYAFDGQGVERVIEPSTYAFSFLAGGRVAPVPDPLRALVQAFVARVSSADPPRVDPAAAPATSHVEAIAAAWPAPLPGRR